MIDFIGSFHKFRNIRWGVPGNPKMDTWVFTPPCKSQHLKKTRLRKHSYISVLTSVLLCTLVTFGPKSAEASSAAEFTALCNLSNSLCKRYLAGFIHGFQEGVLAQRSADESSDPVTTVTKQIGFCAPSNLNVDDVLKIVQKFLTDFPYLNHSPIQPVITAALSSTYPCSKD